MKSIKKTFAFGRHQVTLETGEIARQAGVVATKTMAADALDLRHRLPLLWEAVQDLRLPDGRARLVRHGGALRMRYDRGFTALPRHP